MKEPGRSGLREWRTAVAPALLVALVLPALGWRAGLESSLWMDEVYTLQLVHRAPAQLLDLTAHDVHTRLARRGRRAASRSRCRS